MLITSVLILVICIHLFRKYLLRKETSIKNHEDFNGDLYHVGHSIMAHVKNTGLCDKTIICMHGWLEDYRYFTQLYTSNDGEIILINSCDYNAANKKNKGEQMTLEGAMAKYYSSELAVKVSTDAVQV